MINSGINLSQLQPSRATEKKIIQLHVIVKNSQSIRAESRFEDFCTELVACDHGLIFFSETWRSAVGGCFFLPSGGHIFLSGRLSHQVVACFVGENAGTLFTHVIPSVFCSFMPPQIYIPRPKHSFFVMLCPHFLGR